MSSTREDMLRELELLPAWQLNAPLSPPLVVSLAELPTVPVEQTVAPIEQVVAKVEMAAELVLGADVANMDWATLNQQVLGAGDPNADWLFVGDTPSDEDKQAGQPFTGDAGLLLDKMLMAIQLQRSKNVYLTHLSEPAYLHRQIALIQPKLLFVFGETAAQALLNSQAPLDDLRGKLHLYQGLSLIVSYTPSHLIQHPQDKAKAWSDLCLARDTMQSLKEADVKANSL